MAITRIVKRCIVVIVGAVLVNISFADLDGSQILMEEALRAQEVQKLQYQAELLKQRAEIAKYVDEIKKHGGDVSDFGFPKNSVASAPAYQENSDSSKIVPKKGDRLPTLLQIESGRAAFDTDEGRVFGRVGQTLPGGYRVVDISIRNGVRLQKAGMHYDIDVAW
jgi:type IV pilus biogenesis protein PilP